MREDCDLGPRYNQRKWLMGLDNIRFIVSSMNIKCFGLSAWKNEIDINWDGDAREEGVDVERRTGLRF